MRRIPLLLTGAMLAIALLAGFFAATDTRATFERMTRLLDWLHGSGPASWAGFILVQAAVATVGVLPASLLGVAAGMTYGVWGGFLVAAAGSLLGAWMAFGLSRSFFRPWITSIVERSGRLMRFDDAIGADDWRFVCLVRISPLMPFSLTSYALGLTRIGYRAYLTGTLASLPALLVYVAIGAFTRSGLAAATGEMNQVHGIFLGLGMIAIIVTSLYLRRMMIRVLADEQSSLPSAA